MSTGGFFSHAFRIRLLKLVVLVVVVVPAAAPRDTHGRNRTGRNRRCAGLGKASALITTAPRVMGDSLSDKFDFRLIMSRAEVFSRGSVTGRASGVSSRKFKAAYPANPGLERRHESMM